MRTLYLLRHAKSGWKDETLADFDRPLAGRGRKACKLIAKVIQEKNIKFDLALCSPAIRARQTIELVWKAAKLRTEILYDQRIYAANARRLLGIVRESGNDRKNVLLVGHNPGLEDLLSLLASESERLPTASLVKLKLNISKWAETSDNKAALDWIVRPRELDTD